MATTSPSRFGNTVESVTIIDSLTPTDPLDDPIPPTQKKNLSSTTASDKPKWSPCRLEKRVMLAADAGVALAAASLADASTKIVDTTIELDVDAQAPLPTTADSPCCVGVYR